MHEHGDADHELIDEHERDRFAGTSALDDRRHHRRDRRPRRDRQRARARDGTTGEGSEFEHGREVGHDEERAASASTARTDDQPADAPGSRRAWS